MKRFIRKLMQQMTLDEKIGQLNLAVMGNADTGTAKSQDVNNKVKQGKVGGIFGLYDPKVIYEQQKQAVEASRLKIPLMFGFDVIHGHRTIFPIPLALSCSWDMNLIERTATAATKEATLDGINWLFSPMVDISRDPRWGRVSEGSGEDPYLGSCVAKAMVKGIQGQDLSLKNTALACVKHFALYGAAEGGRDYNTVDMSKIKMFEDYLPPYKAAIDAGAGSLMTAFNDVNGVPSTANEFLLNEVLRKQWGFKGLTVTDYTAINELVHHGIGDLSKVSALALKAGVDMDMVGEGFLNTLKDSVEKGLASRKQIDKACQHVLEAKYKLGLFEDPYRYIHHTDAAEGQKISYRDLAKEAAEKACVLLQNKDNVLPLVRDQKIALIGPLAKDKRNLLGSWSIAGNWGDAVSVFEGIESQISPKGELIHSKGSNVTSDENLAERANFAGTKVKIDKSKTPEEMIKEAKKVASKSDVIVAVLGEAQEMSGECASRTDIRLPIEQRKLLKELAALNKPIVLVVLAGRPLDISKEVKLVDSVLYSWQGGVETGNGISSVLFGDYNPSGKLTMSFPQNVGQIPVYYNHKVTGRPISDGKEFEKFKSCYLDSSNEPLYPFGFGLSYTDYDYSDLNLSASKLKGEGQSLKASVKIKNAGNFDGEEIVQLYIRDLEASITPSVKRLKGFKKVFIKAGEEQEVTFNITTDDLKFFNSELKHDWEPGEFEILIGSNSSQTKSAKVVWDKNDPFLKMINFLGKRKP